MPGDTFILRTDASIIAVGGELVATRDSNGITSDRPIFFFFCKLGPAQQSYHVQELEALAVLEGLNRAMKITNSQEIIVETDHSALVQWAEGVTNNIRLSRWQPKLACYNIRIRYIKGSCNITADMLSRLYQDPQVEVLQLQNQIYGFKKVIEIIKLDHPLTLTEIKANLSQTKSKSHNSPVGHKDSYKKTASSQFTMTHYSATSTPIPQGPPHQFFEFVEDYNHHGCQAVNAVKTEKGREISELEYPPTQILALLNAYNLTLEHSYKQTTMALEDMVTIQKDINTIQSFCHQIKRSSNSKERCKMFSTIKKKLTKLLSTAPEYIHFDEAAWTDHLQLHEWIIITNTRNPYKKNKT